jgi:hypothetical protein
LFDPLGNMRARLCPEAFESMAPIESALRAPATVGLVRVGLLDLPPMLRSIVVGGLVAADNVEWVELGHGVRMPLGVDVVIRAGAGDDAEALRRLLHGMPDARVINTRRAGADAALYELQPRRTMLRDVGIADLMRVVANARPYDWTRWSAESQ